MKRAIYFKQLHYVSLIISFILYSCEKDTDDNKPEIIGKSVELIAYEAIIERINNNVYECSTFVATGDGGAVLIENIEDNVVKISRVDETGESIWNLIYKKTHIKVIEIEEVIQAADGSFVLTGGISMRDAEMDVLLLKISEEGTIIWEKIYHSYGWQIAHSVEQTYDGWFLIIGSNDKPLIDNLDDYYIIYADMNGELQMDYTHGNPDEIDFGLDIIECDDDDYIMVGCMNFMGQIHRVDCPAGIVWNISLKTDFSACLKIIEANDGGYIVLAGYWNPEDIYSKAAVISLIKIDDSGNIIWQKYYGNYKELESVILGNLLNSGYYLIVRQIDPNSDEIIYSILTFTNSGELIE